MRRTRVRILDGGSLEVNGFQAFWNRGPAEQIRIPCYSVLIEHADGLYLFDTGFDLQHTKNAIPGAKPRQRQHQTLPGQLALINLSPRGVAYVINSHFHFDHCGGNRALEKADVICHRREYEAAENPLNFEAGSYSDVGFLSAMSDRRIFLFSGDQELADGIWLFETPGHTAGHYSLLVELTGRRPMLFTADAVYSKKSLDLMCISSFHLDPVAATRSMARVAQLAEDWDAELFFPHDPVHYTDYRKSPNFYE
ncbi:N-acyl homoserine lactonase family protein [Streptomyces collinus]|uniref:4-pyridoxolactonase n=1 Tax=Streptomyces collinus TaxID=42684 RepID=UPI0036BBCF79